MGKNKNEVGNKMLSKSKIALLSSRTNVNLVPKIVAGIAVNIRAAMVKPAPHSPQPKVFFTNIVVFNSQHPASVCAVKTKEQASKTLSHMSIDTGSDTAPELPLGAAGGTVGSLYCTTHCSASNEHRMAISHPGAVSLFTARFVL